MFIWGDNKMTLEKSTAHWRDSIFVDTYGNCWRTKIYPKGAVGVECMGQEKDLLPKDEKRVEAGRKGMEKRWKQG